MKRLLLGLTLSCLPLTAFDWYVTGNSCQYNWNGFYIGFNGGLAWGISHVSTATAFTSSGLFGPEDAASINKNGSHGLRFGGFAGGGQIGYNWRLCRSIVGLETDFNAFYLHKKHQVRVDTDTPLISYSIHQRFRTDWLYTLRFRVGGGCNEILYATGGLALTNLEYRDKFRAVLDSAYESATVQRMCVGWTIGGGLEHVWSRCWSVKWEYLYADFGEITSQSTLITAADDHSPFYHSAKLRAHITRVGINKKM